MGRGFVTITAVRLLLLMALVGGALFGNDAAPSWVQELSTRTTAAYPAQVHSVTLLAEEHCTVEPNGKMVVQYRHAVRVLTREGKQDADAFIEYVKGSAKIRDFHAWLVGRDGFTKSYGKDKVIDLSLVGSFELYDEMRVRMISAGEPDTCSTFAWSGEVEYTELVPQIFVVLSKP